MGWFSRLFGTGSKATGPSGNPAAAADYVPTPKAKDPTAMHPLVRAKLAQGPKPRAVGIGIVYDATGRPKITRDWLEHLNADERVGVDANLAAHGWRVTPELTIEAIEKV